MALKPVTDPNLLSALNTAPAPDPAAVPGPKAVTDPAVLAQLNAPEAPPVQAPDDNDMSQWVPTPGGGFRTPSGKIISSHAPAESSATSNLDELGSDIGAIGNDIWTTIKGAPEVAMNAVGNLGTNITAGLTAPFVGSTPDDQAGYIKDFQNEHLMQPQGESAQKLTAALGDAFDLSPLKQALGETTLNVTGSPLAATGADMLPDLGMAIFGGPKAATGEIAEAPVALGQNIRYRLPDRPADLTAPGANLSGVPENAPKVAKPVSPIVGDLRAADIRMRPSDVRAMNPDKSVKVPGEFREKFASGPKLKNELTLHNQAQLTKANAKDLGIKDLTDASLDAAEAPAIGTYNTVEDVLREHKVSPEFEQTFREGLDSIKLELPRGKPYTVTGVLGALRRRAAKRLQADNPEMEARGYADRNMADAIEEGLGNELKSAGEPQLFKEYQDARQLFAKVNDVRGATRAGQIDANVAYKMKKRDIPLSGALKLTADAAEHAPNVTGHSLKTAARAGEEIPGSKEGIFKSGAKAIIRRIPGMDVGSEGFQQTLGKTDPARASYHGREADIAPAPGPEQGGLDLREALNLEPPPGAVGALQRMPRELGPQVDALGNAFEFQMPPGEVGVPPPEQMSLQDLLGLGEPLNLKNAPGRVGKPKRKP